MCCSSDDSGTVGGNTNASSCRPTITWVIRRGHTISDEPFAVGRQTAVVLDDDVNVMLGAELGQLAQTVGGPTGVRGRRRDSLLAGVVVEHAASRIDEQHLARAEAAAGDLAVAVEVDRPGLRAGGDQPVLANGVPQRAQAVAVATPTRREFGQ